MPPIRVLIVDDSVVARRALSDALSSVPEIEVIGTSSDGRLALARMAMVRPDVVTLDVEMPGMDGLETLTEIRKRYPEVKVIMVSSLTERAARTTLDALTLGAVDCIAKPSGAPGAASFVQIRELLIAKILAFVPRPPTGVIRPPQRFEVKMSNSINVIAIGCSTGGPNALTTLLQALPTPLPVPVVIVQHMPPVFTQQLARRLAVVTNSDVAEATDGEVLAPGMVRIAPGDFHMTARREGIFVKVALNRDNQENSVRPSVDVLFRSVAEAYGPHTIAVVLTGMGQDGLRGCQHLREVGAQVVVQDEATSVVWGMPGFVARAGLAHAVLPLDELGNEIMQRLRSRAGSGPTEGAP